MSKGCLRYPFAAVYGMDDAKRALLCAAVNPRLRTVLIRGGPGSAKTTLARSFGDLIGRRIVNVPLNASEEQIFGGMDVEATLRTGRAAMTRGLMAEANEGILYIDDANLMDQRVLVTILDCVESGEVRVEREGVSGRYTTDTILVATMNPEDSDVSAHVLDRFDLCAYSDFPDDNLAGREEVLRRNAVFLDDPESFSAEYADDGRDLSHKIEHGRLILPLTTISDELIEVAAGLSDKVSADGMRGDIAMVYASRAIAALDGRDRVSRRDLEEAAMIALAHRRRFSPAPPPPPRERADERSPQDEPPAEDRGESGREQEGPHRTPPQPEGGVTDIQQTIEDMFFEIGRQFRVIDYLEGGPERVLRTSSRKGRRNMAESSDANGRYARSRIPEGRTSDVAFDATVRAAAPYQSTREHHGLAVEIEKQDIRMKVRERRSGCTILFLVDASGSLGVRRRMATVKGAVLSMLRDSYVKRDSVGMMAFRRDSAELILPPTRSVEYSYRKLEELPTGGKTPLAEALLKASDFMTAYTRSHPGEPCYVVLVTDGRANVPLREGEDANEEVRRLSAGISVPGTKWVVIDAGSGYARFDNAERLAEGLRGTYFRLEELDADRLAEVVRTAIG